MRNYKIIYYLNTACAERRPETKEDIENDWIVEEKEYSSDLEAFEYAYIEILDNDEDDLLDLYEDLPDQNDLTKINAIKESFEETDIGDGSTFIISIEGGKETYDSGLDKSYFESEVEDEDEGENLDESSNKNELNKKRFKKLNEDDDYNTSNLEDAVQELIETLIDLTDELAWDINEIYDNCAILEGDYNWNNKFEEFGGNIVKTINKIGNDIVYDLEVKDNHNFIVSKCSSNSLGSGFIAHNCQDLSVLQQLFAKLLNNNYNTRFIYVRR